MYVEKISTQVQPFFSFRTDISTRHKVMSNNTDLSYCLSFVSFLTLSGCTHYEAHSTICVYSLVEYHLAQQFINLLCGVDVYVIKVEQV